jgi:DNA invertase Pin-like site-specific DNA recombinase
MAIDYCNAYRLRPNLDQRSGNSHAGGGFAEAGFGSLTEAIDTTTPTGRMLMLMVGGFRCVRTRSAARKNEGWVGVRPPGRTYRLTPEADGSTAVRGQGDRFKGHKTAADAARLFRIHPATVCRLLGRPTAPTVKKAKPAK